MRSYYLILFAFFLYACGGQTAPQEASTSVGPGMTPGAPASTVSADSEPVGPADINITVNGMPDGPALLIGYFETDQYRVDSAYVSNEKLRFQRKQGYDQGFYFVFFSDRSTLQLLLGEDQEFSLTATAGDLNYSPVVEGSIDNELFYESQRIQASLNQQVQELDASLQGLESGTPEYEARQAQRKMLVASYQSALEELFAKAPDSFFTSFKSAGQNPDIEKIKAAYPHLDDQGQVFVYRQQFWDNVNFNDKRLMRTPVIINKLKRYITELTPQTPDSITASADRLIARVDDGKHPEYFKFFVNWVAINYQPTKTTLMDSEAVMVHMVQNYFTNEKAFWAQPAEIQGLQQRASEMAASLVGRVGPDVTSTGPDGKMYSISEMKEPYIVVYMYNPECEHCQEETPLLKAYHDKNKKKLGVYAIALDTDDAKWKAYIEKVGMHDFINVFDPTNRSIYARYFVDKTPEMYVLDRERKIIGKNLKTFQVEELINNKESKR